MRELVHDAGRRSWPDEAFANCEACRWWLERRDNRTTTPHSAAHVGTAHARVGKSAHPALRVKSKVAKVAAPMSGALL